MAAGCGFLGRGSKYDACFVLTRSKRNVFFRPTLKSEAKGQAIPSKLMSNP